MCVLLEVVETGKNCLTGGYIDLTDTVTAAAAASDVSVSTLKFA